MIQILQSIVFVCCFGLLYSCGDQKATSEEVVAEAPDSDFDLSEAQPPASNVYASKPKKTTESLSNKDKISETVSNKESKEKSVNKPKKESTEKPQSKPKGKKKKRPKISYDSLVYHLPDVIEGEILHHDIHFTNTGDAPLSISYVKPSCGCTQPSFPFLDIAPGEGGIIGVDYHSVGKSGPQMAELTVTTNTEPKTSIVTLEVNVLPKEEK